MKAEFCMPVRTTHSFEFKYCDPDWTVYDYSIGDGIWGMTFDTLDELYDVFGQEWTDNVLAKYDESGADEPIEVDIPNSLILKRSGTLINKHTNKKIFSNKCLEHCAMAGVVECPDGSTTEPDGEGSPLIELGLI